MIFIFQSDSNCEKTWLNVPTYNPSLSGSSGSYLSNFHPIHKVSLQSISSNDSTRLLTKIASLRYYAKTTNCFYCGSPKNCPRCAYRKALRMYKKHMNQPKLCDTKSQQIAKEIQNSLSVTILNALIKSGFVDSKNFN